MATNDKIGIQIFSYDIKKKLNIWIAYPLKFMSDMSDTSYTWHCILTVHNDVMKDQRTNGPINAHLRSGICDLS